MLSNQHDIRLIIERDEDGFFVGEVLGLPACYSQGRDLSELLINLCEVIVLTLEDLEWSE